MTNPNPNPNDLASPESDAKVHEAQSPTGRRLLTGGCFLKAFVIVLMSATGLFFVQRWLVPEVDADKTPPVVITDANATSNENGSGTGEPEVPLPKGAISASVNQAMFDQAEHPFDPLLEIAELSLQKIDENIRDYTATMASQVRINGELKGEKNLSLKIRHAHQAEGDKIPFAAYTMFLKPQANVGQEAIWVQGQNNDNLIAHANGLLNIKRFYLDPEGPIAMDGNRYSIRLIGMRNLLVKMADMAREERKHGDCTVTVKRNVEVNGRVCSVFEVVHPKKQDYFKYHIARIYIDDTHNIPVAYEGYLWPEKEGDDPPLLEKYYYTDIEFNVGLTDKDFDPSNEEYSYPKW